MHQHANFDYIRRIVPETLTSFVVPPPPPFPTPGSAIDLWFTQGLYYAGGTVAITDELSISRASIGYAATSAGVLTQFGNDTLRITDLGYLGEETRTNVVLWCNDLTNAAWTPTNITALMDQTGPDAVANSASSILATAANGTILQAITDTSKDRAQSAYVKRLVGSGTIQMTMDNGATWTNITVTSNWAVASIPVQTALANPTVGFRIVTNGDKIAVAFVQNEYGLTGETPVGFSSPILTTTASATRPFDLTLCINALDTLLRSSPLSIILDVQIDFVETFAGYLLGQPAVVSQNWFFYTHDSSNTNVRSINNGATVINATTGSPTFSGGVKLGYADDPTGRSLVMGGGAVSSDGVPVAPTGQVGLVGSSPTGSSPFSCSRIRRLIGWNSRLSNADIQSRTAP